MEQKNFLILPLLLLFLLTACSSYNLDNVETNIENTKKDPGLEKIIKYGKLKVGCKIDVPYFGYLNTKTNQYEGLEIDIAYEIAARIFNVTAEEAMQQGLCEFQGITAKTRGALLDNGEIDIVIGTFTITQERRESWNFSIPYYEDAIGLMSLKERGWNHLSDLNKAVIGIPQGSTTMEKIEQYIKESNIEINTIFQEFDGYPSLSIALITGNIDLFAVDRSILAGYLDDTTIILSDRFGRQEYGAATALYAKELTKLTNQAIEQLIITGRLQELTDKWNL